MIRGPNSGTKRSAAAFGITENYTMKEFIVKRKCLFNLKHLCVIVALMLPVVSEARTFVVLGSGGNTVTDFDGVNSTWWGDLVIAYDMLISHGYTHDQITVLYGEGQDWTGSQFAFFHNKWSSEVANITDYNNHDLTIQHVLDSLSHVITAADTFFYWWVVSHGRNDSGNLPPNDDYKFKIDNQGIYISDAVFKTWIDKINNYAFRLVIWMTCCSGGIVDELANDKTIILTSEDALTLHQASEYGNIPDITYYPVSEFNKLLIPYACGHDFAGFVANADRTSGASKNNKIDYSEYRDAIEANYYRNAGHHPQLAGNVSLAATTYPISHLWKRCIDFSYGGSQVSRMTSGGFWQIKGTLQTGATSGLIFRKTQGVSITTSGNLINKNTDYYTGNFDYVWLDNPSNYVGNLVFKNPNGIAEFGVEDDGSIHYRDAKVQQYIRFQY
jgi:hypothetical protein